MNFATFIRSGHGYENCPDRGRCTAFDDYEIIGNPLGGEYDNAARESRVFRPANGGDGVCYGAYTIRLAKPANATWEGRHGPELYILISHGGGREVWRVPQFYDGGDLQAHILAMPERLQYALLYTLYTMGKDSMRQGEQETRREINEAFVEGRLKKRKLRGSNMYRVSVEPRPVRAMPAQT